LEVDIASEAFRDAARRVSLHTQSTDEDLDYVAQIAALAIAGAGRNRLRVGERIPYTKVAAASRAQAIRVAIRADDLEPLFRLPMTLAPQLRIFLFPIDTPTIHTASFIQDDAACLFANSTGKFDLLACARELGLILALTSRKPQLPIANIQPRSIQSLQGGPREHFCENFAGDLLIPARGLAVALQQVRKSLASKRAELGDVELLYIARIFGVNFLAACRRCERAGLLPPGGGAALAAHLRDNFGGAEARADQLGIPAAPNVSIPSAGACALQWLHDSVRRGEIAIDDIATATRTDPSFLGSMYAVGRSLGEFS